MTPDELKALREEARMSQQELADYLGLRDRSQVRHMEAGRTRITGAKLILLEALKKSLKNRK